MKRGEIAHNVSRGAFYLTLERVAAILSGILYFALLLRWLGPSKYGIMALALSFSGLATMATGNFEVFLERYAAEYRAQGRFRLLLRAHYMALLLKVVLGGFAAGALILLTPFLTTQFGQEQLGTLLPLFALLVAFDGLSTTGRATLFGLQRFRSIFTVAVFFHIAKTVMVGVLWAARQGLEALAVGLVLITLLQGIALTIAPVWQLRRSLGEDQDSDSGSESLGRGMWSYAMPLLGARATFLAGQNLSKVVLGKLFEPFMLGYFSFAFQIIERFVELAHSAPSALLPSLTHLVARKERDRLRGVFDQAHRLIQVAACALSFLVFAFAREITLWVGSPLFEPAVPLLQAMALVPMVRTAQQPLTMLFQALRKPGTVLRLALLKFVSEFGSYFLLIPLLGILGAAVANVLGAVASYTAGLALLARNVPEGAAERARAATLNILLLIPFLVAAWVAERMVPGLPGFVLRLALLPLGLIAVLASGQINRYDLAKLSSIPLGGAAMGRLRDALVEAVERMIRRLERRRTA